MVGEDETIIFRINAGGNYCGYKNSTMRKEVIFMAKRGRPFSEDPKRAKVTVRFTDREYERLQQASKNRGMSALDYIRTLIEEKEIK